MQLLRFRSLWGIEESLESVLPKIKQLGYVGVECPLPNEADTFHELLQRNDLQYIPLIFTSGKSVDEHLQTFDAEVEKAQKLNPLFINAHSGRDAWNETERYLFFAGVVKIEQQKQVRVSHETHRGRILFNPWVTRDVLIEFPELNLCCDFSHWVCVCERLLNDEEDLIALAAKHCLHIHGRVGYEEGPQVPDPRAPEYAKHLQAHEHWWQMLWEGQKKRGFDVSTFTAEYGPPDYMHTLPHTREPVSNLSEICEWQAVRTQEIFKRWISSKAV